MYPLCFLPLLCSLLGKGGRSDTIPAMGGVGGAGYANFTSLLLPVGHSGGSGGAAYIIFGSYQTAGGGGGAANFDADGASGYGIGLAGAGASGALVAGSGGNGYIGPLATGDISTVAGSAPGGGGGGGHNASEAPGAAGIVRVTLASSTSVNDTVAMNAIKAAWCVGFEGGLLVLPCATGRAPC